MATIASSFGAIAVSTSAGAAAPVGIAKINHIVVMMQENRSYDSYFARLHYQGQPASEVEPLTGNPDPLGGATIHPFLKTAECETADLNHSWNGTHQEWNGGHMNGFTAANVDPSDPHGSRTMGYYSNGILPFYYGIANQFAIADRYFASTLTQTFPNRFYLYAGTSFGHIRNDAPIPRGSFYTQPTVFGELAAANVSWRLYVSSFSVAQLFSDVHNHPNNVKPISQYYTDAANGQLPQVSFVESDLLGGVNQESDEHPPANVQVGQKLVHDVMQALVHSSNWAQSAMFFTYDEHGGFYDHVAPPAAVKPDNIAPMLQTGDTAGAFDRYGIRVPAIVISPYAKQHFVSHAVYDHTSILRFIETRFALPTLTNRDAAADPMLGMFDFTTVSHAHPILPNAPIDPTGANNCATLHP